jgi:superfamily II DNA or RNA helicase
MKCVLRERLYVPADEVSPEALEAFTYYFEEYEDVEDASGIVSEQKVLRKVQTVKEIRNPNDGKRYYGFSRGDLDKLKELFGHLEWDDRRAAPPATYNLKVNDSFKLLSYDRDGTGQEEVIPTVMEKRGGILKAPPRFGKTVVTVYLTTLYRLKTLIIIHQKDLLEQFYQEYLRHTNLEEIRQPQRKKRDATGQVVGFFSDYNNPEELDVCLVCWQTLGSKNGPKRIAALRDAFGLHVIDEVHRAAAYKYSTTLNSLNPKYRLGLTGTVARVDNKQKIILDVVGPVIAKGKVRQVPCAVTVIHTHIPVKFSYPQDPLPYLHKRLYKNDDRMRIVLKYLKEDVRAGFYICIGFHRSSQAQLAEFTQILKHVGYSAESFYGDMQEDRETVLNKFRKGEVQIAVCNEAMLTGINVPRWNVYYSMFPTSNVCYEVDPLDGETVLSGNFVQNFSRPRTVFWYDDRTQKKMALIRDFVDDNRHCYGAYKKRLSAYKHEKFLIEHIYEKTVRDKDVG